MRIGIPKENLAEEKRVGLAPAGVDSLIRLGHTVYFEHGAGEESHFPDEDYSNVGATIVFSAEEVFKRSELIAKVQPLTESEAELLQGRSDTIYISASCGRQKNNFRKYA